jgi:cellulase
VNAGDSIAVEMHQQPGDRSCSNEAIGGDHFGPTLIYMAKVADLTTSTPWTENWFKVNQTGLIVE